MLMARQVVLLVLRPRRSLRRGSLRLFVVLLRMVDMFLIRRDTRASVLGVVLL